ncbi:transporter [Shewanella oneidensis MR-1]|uniref:Curli production assembly/transport component CsgG n=1 Tax=Shewanella oneidensis (strain ATCC 700550 / JCM 31522 / CIP 106686 / LMG 19005 / NCIMB 14063 / MR-1) TaxID=211586 RepID=Q8EB49_SHEON|nr:CsgG/HfaB family protein [Shewanella oneidensis]AAN56670.1 curli secretion apparatus outer membrane lipoprotein component CsgG [Shewanella oneidensis MR-1]MDX5998945.1 CsgG/HfaB family protein [Shewanella oneidensis]MEE2027527.1 Curli production assembly/transport component CsgG [Shewanella oneidensis]QKG98022.1 transporter [Shewanella oneidensis MR-1]
MLRFVFIALMLLGMSACSLIPKPDLNITSAQVNPMSEVMKGLQNQPGPKFPIPVAVYSFRDQTGQYKPQANVSSFSTAVTQGATSMLMQTLIDSKWFTPVEREGLQNLLTERKISNKQNGTKGEDIPVLSTARLLLEGGIISYETNTSTGGTGVEYYGIGASEMYREDLVTIYLRAVDVHSGKVMMSVSTSKRVLSQEMRAGLFRYTSLNRLAEAEVGFTTNEPVQFCVLQAIELAVAELIEKGIKQGYWSASQLSQPIEKQPELSQS